ncbi:uncharacterized protein LOC131335984 isoform X1 [Rhododendron vialii]|uniref:uncharacterized protein LOC131335984 isoform X1 n=1 Tax=Rhododendron vialii TaxID=182163 RepID=UPI00265F2FFF|nr:uncharacterized protein LOC131335984 isoform X1 [Rhododendron vialii]XP_058227557.1 uncharacterized protein LOC131335984 isoform X1 [Rhododendron vialii]
MAGREVREYTNLTDPKDRKLGKGKDKIDEEDITFQRMVAKMQEVAGERGGYLHGRGALDSDDLLYLKEQMEAEEDAERLLRRTEKRAFAAFKKSCKFSGFFTCISSLGSTCGVKAKEWNKTARFAEEGGGSQTQAAQSFKPV